MLVQLSDGVQPYIHLPTSVLPPTNLLASPAKGQTPYQDLSDKW